MNRPHNRPVKRVLVMIEYDEPDQDGAEVFDLTALVTELGAKATHQSAHIDLKVEINQDYSPEKRILDANGHWNGKYGTKLSASWSGYVFGGGSTASSGHLEDIMNVILPDGDRTTKLKRSLTKAQKRVEQLSWQVKEAKLDEVASVRHLHPIARVREQVPILQERAAP